MTYFALDFRVADVGGPVGDGIFYAENGARLGWGAEERIGLPGGHVLFLVHGFNNSRRQGILGLGGFAKLVEAARPVGVDAVVIVLWPGDSPWGPLSYAGEEPDADQTATKLAMIIRDRMSAAMRVSFAAHSLGSRVVMQTVAVLSGSRVGIGQVVLMAAAVDRDALARPDRFRSSTEACERVSNLSSTEDRTLKLAFPLGDGLAAILFGGYTRQALGLVGPAASGTNAIPRNVLAEHVPTTPPVGHGDYLPSAKAARFVAEAVGGGPKPRYG